MLEIKNRSATHEFYIEARYEAGIVLGGTEVKSIKNGKLSFNDSFCIIDKNEVWVKSLHIAEYSFGNINNHLTTRDRKLLLKKREIRKLLTRLKEKGLTLIPLRVYQNETNFIKMEIGLAKGKKLHDKRDSIKQKDHDREMKRFLKK